MKTPEEKIRMLKGSMNVFMLGIFSFVPIAGLGIAALALGRFFSIWSVAGKDWNPARRYLYLGMVLAFLGSLVSLLLILIVVAAML